MFSEAEKLAMEETAAIGRNELLEWRANADATFFTRNADGTWTPQHVEQVVWEERKAANVRESGLLEADRLRIRVRNSTVSGGFIAETGGVVAKGLVSETLGAGYTMGDLAKDYDTATIRSVDEHDVGGPRGSYWEIGAS
jgi:hypothetical protein